MDSVTIQISLKQLNLGYQYTITKDENNTVSIFKESGIFIVCGFVDGVHYREANEVLKPMLLLFHTLINTLT